MFKNLNTYLYLIYVLLVLRVPSVAFKSFVLMFMFFVLGVLVIHEREAHSLSVFSYSNFLGLVGTIRVVLLAFGLSSFLEAILTQLSNCGLL